MDTVPFQLWRAEYCELTDSLEYLLHGDDKRAPAQAATGSELALLRLYRELAPRRPGNAAPNRAQTGAGRMKFLAAGKNRFTHQSPI